MQRPPAKSQGKQAAPVPLPAAKIIPAARHAPAAVPAAAYLPARGHGAKEPAPAPQASGGGKKRMSFWRRLGGGSLTVSLILHVALLALGAFWVFQIIPAEKAKVVDFMPSGGGGGDPSSRNPALQKQRMSISRPNLARIAALGASNPITLPEPEESSQIASMGQIGSGGLSGGMGGSGSGGGKGNGRGKGFGDGMGPGLGQGKGMMNPFGMIDPKGENGLVGAFYDFKRDEDGKPSGVKANDREKATQIIKAFAKGKTWRVPRSIPHYTSKTRLSTKTAFFPGVADTEAGKAFQSPDSEAGLWVAHYSATVSCAEGGSWRFVGWGDNCLIVGVNGNVKLDASDRGYTGAERTAIGSADLPGKPGAALYEGEWFQLKPGAPVTIDILIGDEGGIFAAGVLLQRKGEDYSKDARGVPNLPILRTGDLTQEEFEAFKGQLPENALKGPVFLVKPGGGKRDI